MDKLDATDCEHPFISWVYNAKDYYVTVTKNIDIHNTWKVEIKLFDSNKSVRVFGLGKTRRSAFQNVRNQLKDYKLMYDLIIKN